MSDDFAPRIVVDQPSPLIDRPVRIELTGFAPNALVTVSAEMVDTAGVTWRSSAGYHVDASGALRLENQAPSFGAFTEPGADGFFWSMTPITDLSHSEFREQGPPPSVLGAKRGHRLGLPELVGVDRMEVRFTASHADGRSAHAQIARVLTPPDVRRVVIRAGRVRGVLFEPNKGGPLPGVIQISGSGGGVYEQDAALLAASEFSVLALGYFNYDDLPRHQLGVPIEYFEEAIRWFRGHLGHERIGITGPSKGGEGSLVVAANLPDMIKAAAPVVPGDLYLCAVDAAGAPHAAWTREGAPLPWAGTPQDWNRVPEPVRVPKERKLFNARINLEPFYAAQDVYARAAIPVERMKCPLLIIWGQDDQAWPSALAVERIVRRLAEHDYAYPVESYGEQGAGHFFTFPGFPTTLSESIVHPLLPIYMTMGGSPAATARLQRVGWRKLVDFFTRHLAA